MKLKLCGIRRNEDIAMVNNAAPDYIGFIFYEKSHRYVSPEKAKELSENLNKNIKTVGVFVNEPVEKTALIAQTANLKVIQLHGDENENYIASLRKLYKGEIWKAVRVKTMEDILAFSDFPADMLLLDAFTPAYGGSGRQIDLSLLENTALNRPFFLAGGITSKNLHDILSKIRPYGIDVSSGFETDGIKDSKKLKELMNIFKKERRIYNE